MTTQRNKKGPNPNHIWEDENQPCDWCKVRATCQSDQCLWFIRYHHFSPAKRQAGFEGFKLTNLYVGDV